MQENSERLQAEVERLQGALAEQQAAHGGAEAARARLEEDSMKMRLDLEQAADSLRMQLSEARKQQAEATEQLAHARSAEAAEQGRRAQRDSEYAAELQAVRQELEGQRAESAAAVASLQAELDRERQTARDASTAAAEARAACEAAQRESSSAAAGAEAAVAAQLEGAYTQQRELLQQLEALSRAAEASSGAHKELLASRAAAVAAHATAMDAQTGEGQRGEGGRGESPSSAEAPGAWERARRDGEAMSVKAAEAHGARAKAYDTLDAAGQQLSEARHAQVDEARASRAAFDAAAAHHCAMVQTAHAASQQLQSSMATQAEALGAVEFAERERALSLVRRAHEHVAGAAGAAQASDASERAIGELRSQLESERSLLKKVLEELEAARHVIDRLKAEASAKAAQESVAGQAGGASAQPPPEAPGYMIVSAEALTGFKKVRDDPEAMPDERGGPPAVLSVDDIVGALLGSEITAMEDERARTAYRLKAALLERRSFEKEAESLKEQLAQSMHAAREQAAREHARALDELRAQSQRAAELAQRSAERDVLERQVRGASATAVSVGECLAVEVRELESGLKALEAVASLQASSSSSAELQLLRATERAEALAEEVPRLKRELQRSEAAAAQSAAEAAQLRGEAEVLSARLEEANEARRQMAASAEEARARLEAEAQSQLAAAMAGADEQKKLAVSTAVGRSFLVNVGAAKAAHESEMARGAKRGLDPKRPPCSLPARSLAAPWPLPGRSLPDSSPGGRTTEPPPPQRATPTRSTISARRLACRSAPSPSGERRWSRWRHVVSQARLTYARWRVRRSSPRRPSTHSTPSWRRSLSASASWRPRWRGCAMRWRRAPWGRGARSMSYGFRCRRPTTPPSPPSAHGPTSWRMRARSDRLARRSG